MLTAINKQQPIYGDNLTKVSNPESAALKEIYERLKQAINFGADMSYEINNKLQSILPFEEPIKANEPSAPAQDSFISNMLSLITDLENVNTRFNK